MWGLDHKEGWAQKNWRFWTVVLKKTLESPLDCKEIQSINPKGNEFWIFIGRTDAEAEVLILWPPDSKSWLIRKDPDAGKDWRQEEKGMTEEEMVGWHHWLNGHEFEQAPGDGEGQGRLACYSPWGCKELDTTERLNNNNKWEGYLVSTYYVQGTGFSAQEPYSLWERLSTDFRKYVKQGLWHILQREAKSLLNWIAEILIGVIFRGGISEKGSLQSCFKSRTVGGEGAWIWVWGRAFQQRAKHLSPLQQMKPTPQSP